MKTMEHSEIDWLYSPVIEGFAIEHHLFSGKSSEIVYELAIFDR